MTSPSTPNTISGRSAFIELLQSEGVTHLFGNPGTTELPIMHALADYPDMRYVLGLQEAIVVAMADGYARASGELVACNVHVAPGLGNAMGSLFTAFNSGTPLIITAGQQEQGRAAAGWAHRLYDGCSLSACRLSARLAHCGSFRRRFPYRSVSSQNQKWEFSR